MHPLCRLGGELESNAFRAAPDQNPIAFLKNHNLGGVFESPEPPILN